MDGRSLGRRRPGGRFVGVLTVLVVAGVPPLLTFAALTGGSVVRTGVVGLPLLALLVWVGIARPGWLPVALGAVVGAVPLASIPGTGIPIVLLLAAGVLVAAVVHPVSRRAVQSTELAVVALLVTSLLSVVVTGRTPTDALEFVKWLIATGLLLALRRLDPHRLRQVGLAFVAGASVNAVVGLYVRLLDPEGSVLRILGPIGYGTAVDAPRYVYYRDAQTLRLTGTFIDPNAAGIAFFVALVLAVLLLRGRVRVVAASLVGAALVLTLSRASLFSVVVGALLVLLLHPMTRRAREAAFGLVAAAAVAAVAVPQVRERVLSSFGSSDVGSSARLDALRDFPGVMSGHWWFGLGWGRPEFLDGETAFLLNFVANSPLLTVYRGGVLAGLAFTALLVVGVVLGYRLLRGSDLPSAFVGGSFIGFAVVALQLDFPVVSVPVMTVVFTLLLSSLTMAEDRLDGTVGPLVPRRLRPVAGEVLVRRVEDRLRSARTPVGADAPRPRAGRQRPSVSG